MKKYTIGFVVLMLAFITTSHASAATRKPIVNKRHVVKRVVRRMVKKKVKKSAVVLSVSNSTVTAQGSNANPSPVIISNVGAVESTTFANCDPIQNFAEKFGCLINNYRQQNGLNSLQFDSSLTKVASDYSNYMNSANFFSHVAPDGSHYYERCAAQGTTCHAENLAKGFLSAQSLFDMWKSSPSHNENMLGPYTSIGLGVSGAYATTLFRW